MPSKKNSKKGPAGHPGLVETADQVQSSDQTMSTEASSRAAGEPPQQGSPLDAGLVVINAFDDLYETTTGKAVKESDTPLGDQDKEEEGLEEDDEFLISP